MKNQNASNLKQSMNLGVILGLVLICYSIILYMLDLNLNTNMGYISYIIIAVTLFFTIKSYRDNYQNGFITYSKALGTGTLISLFASFLNAFYVYIFYTVIDKDAINKMKDMQVEQMLKNGMSEDQVELVAESSQMFMTPVIMTISTVLVVTFIGFIISLIIAAVLKKEGDSFETEMTDIE